MSTEQLDLLNAVADNTSPLGQDRWERIIAAFRHCARRSNGVVDPNEVRDLLSNEHGLTVPPRQLSASYSKARAAGLIERAGWTTNTDTRGRNGGKPARTYRWIGGVA